MVTIKPILPRDIEPCSVIYMEAYNRYPWNYRWVQDKVTKYLQEYTDRGNFIGFVLYDDEVIAGAVFCHTKTWWTGNQFYIDELFVDPAKQGKGYGKQLMNHCEAWCQAQEIEMITLMTNNLMPAYEFYIANDYMKVDHYVFMFKPVEE
jgi:aminoglycoside 6'-N-acetyltransferase I